MCGFYPVRGSIWTIMHFPSSHDSFQIIWLTYSSSCNSMGATNTRSQIGPGSHLIDQSSWYDNSGIIILCSNPLLPTVSCISSSLPGLNKHPQPCSAIASCPQSSFKVPCCPPLSPAFYSNSSTSPSVFMHPHTLLSQGDPPVVLP